MKRMVMEALAAYALCVVLESLVLGGAGAQVWGGVLGMNVFAASFLAGWAHLRRLGEGAARPEGGFWWSASLGIGLGLALGAVGAANAFRAVAAMLPGGDSNLLLAWIFVFGTLCARMSFRTLAAWRDLPPLEKGEPAA
ncbi:hypothetical protein [Neomegalonema sp.]|uniref:hypothetical protein n=1 Tax=Neomegalonema sp. TaxID=2039713 RepID=UPI0026122651|nr:hypothetical protein [Neomegalonema sp.]MDD2869842.1 hypothetical protein [Neomegalonema sp.]